MKTLNKMILAGALLNSTSFASAALLTFDDIPNGSIENSVGSMPVYKGYEFNRTLNWVDLEGSSWNYGAHSGQFSLLNNYGGSGRISASNGNKFTFDGLWAKQWANRSGLTGTLQGYSDNVLIWSVTTALDGNYQYFSAHPELIDELQLNFGNFFLADDIALSEISEVPLPAAAWLFGTGLVGLAGIRRKKLKQA